MILKIARKIGLRNLITLAMLLAAINCLTAGLGVVIRGATVSAFLPVAISAALLGWGLATIRTKSWLAWSTILALDVLLLTSATAQLGVPLLELAKLLPATFYQLLLWARDHISPDFSAASAALSVIGAQYVRLWGRMAHWTQGMLNGANLSDPVARVLAWSLLLWLIAAWAGWFLRRRQTLTAMAPSLVLLAVVGDYIRGETWPLWGLVSITVLLMGLLHYETHFRRWVSFGIDYAEIIQGNTIIAVVLVSAVLALAAWVTPFISLKAVTDALNRPPPQSKADQTVAKALGLEQPPAPADNFVRHRTSSLPNLLLILAGPDLAHTPVMSIRTGELPPGTSDQLARVAPRHHWRSNTFDRYTGTGWASSGTKNEKYNANAPVLAQIPRGYRVLHQEVILEDDGNGRLYWDGTLYRADQPYEVGWRTQPNSGPVPSADPLQGADGLGAISDAKMYGIDSLLPTFSQEQLRASPATYPPEIAERYLNLPTSVPERVLVLGRDLTATALTPFDRAKAIETYLRSTYPYTLDVEAPPPGVDVADYFLFELKKGYCDYFATSMVVLARAAGLPARIVIGYANGTYDPFNAEYNITQADAHAWAEVYFSGIGWVEFEPTPSQPGFTLLLVGGPSGGDTEPLTSPQEYLGKINTLLQGLVQAPRWSMYGLLAFLLILLLAALQLLEHWLLVRIPASGAVKWIYRGIYRLGRNLTGPPGAGQTPSEFAHTLQAKLDTLTRYGYLRRPFKPARAELGLLTDLYLRVSYTENPPQKGELLRALRAWRNLRWRLLLARVTPVRKPNSPIGIRQSEIENRKTEI